MKWITVVLLLIYEYNEHIFNIWLLSLSFHHMCILETNLTDGEILKPFVNFSWPIYPLFLGQMFSIYTKTW